MKAIKKQIERWIGGDAVEVAVQFEHGEAVGYASARRAVWPATQKRIEAALDEARAVKVQFFVGAVEEARPKGKTNKWGGFIRYFAFQQLTPTQVGEIARVGMPPLGAVTTVAGLRRLIEMDPNSFRAQLIRAGTFTLEDLADPDPNEQRKTMREFFESLYEQCPYDVLYADRKGWWGRFREAVSRVNARWIEQRVMRLNPEAMDVIDVPIAEYVQKHRLLKLWWD